MIEIDSKGQRPGWEEYAGEGLLMPCLPHGGYPAYRATTPFHLKFADSVPSLWAWSQWADMCYDLPRVDWSMWMRRVILRVGSGATPGLAGLGQDHPLALSLPTKSFWTKDESGEGFQGAVHKKDDVL